MPPDPGRVTLHTNGERITADSAVFWEAVRRVDEPLVNLAEFRDTLASLEGRE